MKYFIISAAICVGAQAVSIFDLASDQWETYKFIHEKQYENVIEESLRRKIYMENAGKVTKHNHQMYAQGLVSYKLKVNKWSDMSHQEFVQTVNGFNRKPKDPLGINENINGSQTATSIPAANTESPDSVDWREVGAVTAVKNQGKCAACWSFSATGALEAQHFLKTKHLVSLSEQNLIDCTTKYGNKGCVGGLMDYAFQYIKDNQGLDTEISYPYEAQINNCTYNESNNAATDRGYIDIEPGNEDKLKSAVATVGPISIGIDGSHESFQQYSEGVYYEPECSSEDLDHAVLVVGYGTDKDTNADYWLIKNSWGESWGDKGFGKMARNKNNNCGVATEASYPLV